MSPGAAPVIKLRGPAPPLVAIKAAAGFAVPFGEPVRLNDEFEPFVYVKPPERLSVAPLVPAIVPLFVTVTAPASEPDPPLVTGPESTAELATVTAPAPVTAPLTCSVPALTFVGPEYEPPANSTTVPGEASPLLLIVIE